MREKYRENYRLLGLRIAYYRKVRGYTQEQLAEMIGKSWSFLSQIEANNGTRLKGLSLETLFSIAEALQVSAGRLFDQD
ncbi:MAG: helix-turn-helix transcriptional regulator [Oscillibacter sp.]|nr:helix-turn-helix transcriptional regulator [Oscillibacter sp.]MEA4994211.1 helix-turn-helix transcriptional regulator [Oscillibacter sp.]